MADTPGGLRRTPLHDLHLARGARMVPFAGWEMPVQYPMGVLGEHNHTRAKAGLFDVSHMGQIVLRPAVEWPSGHARPAAHEEVNDLKLRLETLVAADVLGIPQGRQRYGLFTTPEGGVLDDLMIADKGDHLLLVVNAANVEADLAHLRTLEGTDVVLLDARSLMALQGPEAEAVLERLVPGVAAMRFMDVAEFDWDGARLWVSRSGYTGEDGFEISIPDHRAVEFAEALLGDEAVALIGLGARDSLRLEAGMPLYGNDMDAGTTPGSAGLGWSIPKVRRTGGARAGGFPGAERILAELAEGAKATRRGLRPEGRAPIREGVPLYEAETGGEPIGTVRSGGFGPTVGGPIATATLPAHLPEGATVWAELRGKRIPATIVPLPFIKPSYKR
ncbi:glycine cleavage system aminomethyltransferase GcvT [Paracoccus sp. S-4012]|uniref:glycine cleavage system aminomethyltransferase GcvT n=1 Tax=Paracoccus sp. S-4012 TaxID=2665648 RepID=UPI0012AFE920|nr:glycine cleavage system aminomethyltransferase GcvT [Paracoccus sp. S-4012]MRX49010.1 glycine cleavage system aminomethyltransferase GcvT [Paracoccus sp. S-4012]